MACMCGVLGADQGLHVLVVCWPDACAQCFSCSLRLLTSDAPVQRWQLLPQVALRASVGGAGLAALQ